MSSFIVHPHPPNHRTFFFNLHIDFLTLFKMNSSAKHAAPPISPARVQSSAKKNKKQQSSGVVRQSTLFQSFNIVKIDEVSAMEASHTRFNCINNIFEELDGQPIMFNFEKKEEATCLEKEVDDIILKMSDPTVEESTFSILTSAST
jgi:hypothetical protein